MSPPSLFLAEDGRFFLVPGELPAGDLLVSGGAGDRRVDAAAIAPYEVTKEQAEAHVRLEMQQAVSGVADAIAGALGQGSADLAQVAERLGLTGGDSGAAFKRLADDVYALTAAVTSGAPDDIDAARARLQARGIDLGDSIERLRALDEERAAEWMRRMAAELDDGEQPLGRRIDELIARLEHVVGPWLGRDPEKIRQKRQAEYRSSARSSIADALRDVGIEPLNDPRDESSTTR